MQCHIVAHMQHVLASSRVICFRSSPGLSTMPAHNQQMAGLLLSNQRALEYVRSTADKPTAVHGGPIHAWLANESDCATLRLKTCIPLPAHSSYVNPAAPQERNRFEGKFIMGDGMRGCACDGLRHAYLTCRPPACTDQTAAAWVRPLPLLPAWLTHTRPAGTAEPDDGVGSLRISDGCRMPCKI